MPPALRVPPAPQVRKVLQGSELLAPQDPRVKLALLVLPALQVLLDPRVLQDQKVRRELSVPQVLRDLLVPPDQMEPRVPPVPRDLVLQVQLVLLAPQVHRELPDH